MRRKPFAVHCRFPDGRVSDKPIRRDAIFITREEADEYVTQMLAYYAPLNRLARTNYSAVVVER